MSNFTSRPTLPDSWAEKSHCPICGMIPLWVLHQQAAPDEMNCPRCGTAFQVETAGRHLYLTQTPPGYLEPVGERWLPAKDIRSYTKEHPWHPETPASSQPEPPLVPSAEDEKQTSPSQQSNIKTAQLQPEAIPDYVAGEMPTVSAELVEKARELHELGNSRYKIRTILIDTEKISNEEADEIINVAFQEADKKNERQNRTLLIVGGILVVLCICSIIAVSIIRNLTSPFSSSFEDSNTRPPAAQQAPGSQNNQPEQENLGLSFLPDAVEQLMPLLAGEPPDFPTAQILQGAPTGNKTYACPTNEAAAVSIFGGTASSWTMTSEPQSWAYFSLTPTTIYIPNGLTGEILYLNESGGGTRSAPGPATIQNATIILIMCEQ
jgi:hypothetical protein